MLSVLVVVLVAGAAWVSMPVRSASACSTGNEYDFVAGSTSAVLGTVAFVGEMQVAPPRTSKSDPEPPPNDRMTPVRIEVSRTLRGVEQPGVIEVFAAIRDPENEGNLPCFPLEREAVLGNEAVIALWSSSAGTMQFSSLQYWAVDEPIDGRMTREVLASVYNGTYPGMPAAGTGLASADKHAPGMFVLAGGSLLPAAAATWLATMRRSR